MNHEQQLIRKIEAGIFAVKNKHKSPQESNLAPLFLSLKKLNVPMYEDLIQKYKLAINIYKA